MYKNIDISKENPESKLCYIETFGNDNEDGETLHIRMFFTDIPLSEQWGDDWDDAPYDCYAEIPYDDFHNKDGNMVEHTIYVGEVVMNNKDWSRSIMLPKDYVYNSPFSVADINSGAVAWIYRHHRSKKIDGKALYAGASPKETYEFLEDIIVKCIEGE